MINYVRMNMVCVKILSYSESIKKKCLLGNFS